MSYSPTTQGLHCAIPMAELEYTVDQASAMRTVVFSHTIDLVEEVLWFGAVLRHAEEPIY